MNATEIAVWSLASLATALGGWISKKMPAPEVWPARPKIRLILSLRQKVHQNFC